MAPVFDVWAMNANDSLVLLGNTGRIDLRVINPGQQVTQISVLKSTWDYCQVDRLASAVRWRNRNES